MTIATSDVNTEVEKRKKSYALLTCICSDGDVGATKVMTGSEA